MPYHTEAQVIAAIPPHMRRPLLGWIRHGNCPASFLCAVLTNDFARAACNADEDNAAALVAWAKFMLWIAPSACWGSEEAMERWALERKETGPFRFDVEGWPESAETAAA